nr:MAG TPA: hypothetical protein [Caudoviricetes sp.]
MGLDLAKRKQKYFDLTMVDGTKLQIKKANEELIYEMEEFEKRLRKSSNVKEVFEGIKTLVLKIINRNTANKVYDALLFNLKGEDGELLYDYDVCMAIFAEYNKFTYEVLRNPN